MSVEHIFHNIMCLKKMMNTVMPTSTTRVHIKAKRLVDLSDKLNIQISEYRIELKLSKKLLANEIMKFIVLSSLKIY